MTWVFEEPLTIGILSAITLVLLGFAWWQTGYRWLLHAWLGAASLTIGLLLLEHLVETETEQIEATLHRIARDVERNDLNTILSHVYSGAPETLALARSEFPRYEFRRVTIKRNVEVTLNQAANPPSADVTFNVVVDVSVLGGGFDGPVARFVRVTLRKEGGAWKVAEYAHDEPFRGLRIPAET